MKRVKSLSLSRRTLLRGMGASLALPFMEAMLPRVAKASTGATPKRLSVVYSPNGMAMTAFTPSITGRDYEMTPILEPLAHLRKDFLVINGLGMEKTPGHIGCAGLLTGSSVRQTEGSDLQCGISMDQVLANHYSGQTQFSSLQMGIEPSSLLGSCAPAYSCTYTNTLSWRSDTTALPVSNNPADVFERMFGDGNISDEQARIAQLRRKKSVLDFVREDAVALSGQLGMHDRRKLDEYLDAVRDVEMRIQMASQQNADVDYSSLERPSGIPDGFKEHVQLMVDLQVLALQTDLTRVTTFMLGRELSNRAYPEIDVSDSHHMLSHHAGDKDRLAKLERINRYHKEQFAYYLERLRATPDGEGSLLDSTIVLSGTCMGDSDAHDSSDLPVIVAGGGVAGGRHLAVPRGTPISNLHVGLLQRFGIATESFGDSNGSLDIFSA